MARRIHNIDFRAVVKQRRVLGENRDSALSLQFVGVHDAIDMSFVGAESTALLEHGVDQRCLTVVHVGDDCDVANVH